MYFTAIQKRDGRVTDFDAAKITAALLKAGKATGEFEEREARRLTMQVLSLAKAVLCRIRPMWKAFRMWLSRCCLIRRSGQRPRPTSSTGSSEPNCAG